jgi:hypothetical protein
LFYESHQKNSTTPLSQTHPKLDFLSRFLRVFKEERNLLIKEEKREKGWLVTF